ncbi:hypothetical protein [Clostridium sp.]|nr:hypothetical protein [Clostridium sp.]
MEAYIISTNKMFYFEDGHLKWVHTFKDKVDRKATIKHLKEFKSRIIFA